MKHPGDLVLSPWALVAVAMVVVNDHVLKARYGNVVTGKLSDVAGVFVFPLVALSVLEVGRWGLRRSSWVVTKAEIVAGTCITAIGFAAVKLVGPVADTYAATIGSIRWSVEWVTTGSASYAPIEIVADWTDVAVLPVLIGSLLVARARIPATDRTAAGPCTVEQVVVSSRSVEPANERPA